MHLFYLWYTIHVQIYYYSNSQVCRHSVMVVASIRYPAQRLHVMCSLIPFIRTVFYRQRGIINVLHYIIEDEYDRFTIQCYTTLAYSTSDIWVILNQFNKSLLVTPPELDETWNIYIVYHKLSILQENWCALSLYG